MLCANYWIQGILMLVFSGVKSSHSPACPPLALAYGRISYQNAEKTASFSCNPDFEMMGSSSIRCSNGSWSDQPPICFSTHPGCNGIPRIRNGYIYTSHDNGVMSVHCNVNYERVGSEVLFCNGTKWNDTVIPACKQKSQLTGSLLNSNNQSTTKFGTASTSTTLYCSFEAGTCGWIQETTSTYKWTLQNGIRPDGNADVGPAHDARSPNGMYMFARPATGGNPADLARLLSPILNATVRGEWCVTLSYYLHGIRPRALSVMVSEFGAGNASRQIAQLSGDHGDKWIRAEITVENQTDRFRVVFETRRGEPYAADVALDEISVRSGVCDVTGNATSILTEEPLDNTDSIADDVDLSGSLFNVSTNDTNNMQEVNIDIYEEGNRSFVDEPSVFTIQVIHPRSATINPTNFGYLGYLNANGQLANAPGPATNGAADDRSQRLHIGVAVGVSILTVVIIAGLLGLFFWRRKRRLNPSSTKTGTEETEFQYFSYSNDGFREVATMSADRKSIRA